MERFDEMLARAAAVYNDGKIAQACYIYDRLLGERPDDPLLLLALGTGLGEMHMYGTGVQLLQKALTVPHDDQDPTFEVDCLHNMGVQQRRLGLTEEAAATYLRALHHPAMPKARLPAIYGNLSGCYVNEGQPERCLELANLGLVHGDLPALRNHKALALLEMGRYAEGFAEYECRYQLDSFHNRDYGAVPRWDGKPVRRLAIHGEQGLGDEILALTMLHKALPLAEEIAIECAQRLVGLLRASFKDYPQVQVYGEHKELIARFQPDAYTAMFSLFNLLWPFAPWTYLKPARSYFRDARIRVGVSWRGGTTQTHEYHRNAPLQAWRPIIEALKAADLDVISVQYGPAKEMAEAFAIPHDEQNIADLHTLASMIKSCDVVLTCCNTTVHLAGALGVPTVVTVPTKPAWRYGVNTGNRSDWYESVEYVRQARHEAWASVLERAYERVQAHVDYRRIPAAKRASA